MHEKASHVYNQIVCIHNNSTLVTIFLRRIVCVFQKSLTSTAQRYQKVASVHNWYLEISEKSIILPLFTHYIVCFHSAHGSKPPAYSSFYVSRTPYIVEEDIALRLNVAHIVCRLLLLITHAF